jgi:hypothetical protein
VPVVLPPRRRARPAVRTQARLLFLGAVLARGQRTVTSWIRAAKLSDQFRPCYTAVAAAGKRADRIARRLLTEVSRPLLKGATPKHRPEFRTKLELAVELLRWAKPWLDLLKLPIWMVTDGAYATKNLLEPAMPLGMSVVGRLRKDAERTVLVLQRDPAIRHPRRPVNAGVVLQHNSSLDRHPGLSDPCEQPLGPATQRAQPNPHRVQLAEVGVGHQLGVGIAEDACLGVLSQERQHRLLVRSCFRSPTTRSRSRPCLPGSRPSRKGKYASQTASTFIRHFG